MEIVPLKNITGHRKAIRECIIEFTKLLSRDIDIIPAAKRHINIYKNENREYCATALCFGLHGETKWGFTIYTTGT